MTIDLFELSCVHRISQFYIDTVKFWHERLALSAVSAIYCILNSVQSLAENP